MIAPVPKLFTRVIYDMLLNRKECGTGNEMFCAQKGIILGTRRGSERAKMRERITCKVKAMQTMAHSHRANSR